MSFNEFHNKRKSLLATATREEMQEEMLNRDLSDNVFPLEIFHPKIKPYIQELHNNYDISRAYIGLTLLTTYSTAIGTAYAVCRNDNDRMGLSMWGCLLGMSSNGKSIAIDEVMHPIKEIQREMDLEWKNLTDGLTDEKRWRIPMKMVTYRDVFLQTLVRYVLPQNPKGVLKESDELLEWINGLNAMAKGGKEGTDEQFWLSAWDCRDFSAVRSGNVKIVVPRVFTNIIGGIQNKVLHKLFKNDRDVTGFIFRVLFAIPDQTRIARPKTGYTIPMEYRDIHKKAIRKMYDDLPVQSGTDEQKKCMPNQDAFRVFNQWDDALVNKINAIDDISTREIHGGIYGKIKAYAWRFAGLLAVSDAAYDLAPFENFKGEVLINEKIMLRALKAADYFYRSAVKVYDTVDSSQTIPLHVLHLAKLITNPNISQNKAAQLLGVSPMTVSRQVKKYMREYPKAFGANNDRN